jgi:putative transposase
VAIAVDVIDRAAASVVDRGDRRDPCPLARTYGSPQVRAELGLSVSIMVSRKTVAKIMRDAGLAGVPRRQTRKNPKVEVFSEDLVNRDFLRTQPNLLWVCDITEHPTREASFYCCAVLDTFSRKIVGWPIDSVQNTTLVVNDLGGGSGARRGWSVH